MDWTGEGRQMQLFCLPGHSKFAQSRKIKSRNIDAEFAKLEKVRGSLNGPAMEHFSRRR